MEVDWEARNNGDIMQGTTSVNVPGFFGSSSASDGTESQRHRNARFRGRNANRAWTDPLGGTMSTPALPKMRTNAVPPPPPKAKSAASSSSNRAPLLGLQMDMNTGMVNAKYVPHIDGFPDRTADADPIAIQRARGTRRDPLKDNMIMIPEAKATEPPDSLPLVPKTSAFSDFVNRQFFSAQSAGLDNESDVFVSLEESRNTPDDGSHEWPDQYIGLSHPWVPSDSDSD